MNTVDSLKTKNIVFIVHQYAHFQKDYIEEISKNFKHVYVFTRYKPIAEIYNIFKFSFLANHAQINSIDLTGLPDNITIIPTPIFYLPYDFFYKIIGNRQFKMIKSYIDGHKLKFDFIHAHFIWTSGYVGSRLKQVYNKPLIITSHSPLQITQLRDKSLYWKNSIDDVVKKSDLIFSVNKEMTSILKEIYPKKWIEYLPNGYNHKLFRPSSQEKERNILGISNNSKIVLCVGFLDKVKGQDVLVDSISLLKKDIPNIQCFIVGSGIFKDKLKKQIENLHLQDQVILKERVPHSQVSKWINACDCLVVPSLVESFGIVQIEAMSCGKPVVTTNTAGGREILISQDFGYICNISDPNDMANKIKQSLTRKWEPKIMIDYSKRFRLDNISSKAVQFYEKLLK